MLSKRIRPCTLTIFISLTGSPIEYSRRKTGRCRVRSAAVLPRRKDTSPQKDLEPNNEQKRYKGYHVNAVQGPRNEARSLPLDGSNMHSLWKQTKSNKPFVVSKPSRAKRDLHLELKALKEQKKLQAPLMKLKQKPKANLQEWLAAKVEHLKKESK